MVRQWRKALFVSCSKIEKGEIPSSPRNIFKMKIKRKTRANFFVLIERMEEMEIRDSAL